jgi:hypothetical protein
MAQLQQEFTEILQTYPNSIKPQYTEQVEKAVNNNTLWKKDLLVTIDVPVGISHSRLPPIANLV